MSQNPREDAPATQPLPVRILHDVRAVADVADLDPQALRRQGGWLVVRLSPDSWSGSATVPGVQVDGDTGNVVGGVTDGPPLVTRSGGYRVVARLDGAGAGPAQGRYAWTEPQEVRGRGHSRDGVYDPYARGGSVVARPVAGTGTAFEGTLLLPEGWSRDAGAAAGPAAFAQVRRGPGGGNHVAFVQSVAGAARSGDLTDAALADLLAATSGYRRAVTVYLSVRDGGAAGAAAAAARAQAELTGPGADRDVRRGTVLGLAAAHLFGGGLPAAARDVAAAAGAAAGLVAGSAGFEVAEVAEPDAYVAQALRLLVP